MSAFDRFEKIAFIGFTETPEKTGRMEAELMRVGISAYEKEINSPSPFDAILHNALNTSMSVKYVNSTLGHYRVINRAWREGVGSILIMEDDCRFLKDIDHVREAVSALPDDYDVAMLDSIRPCGMPSTDHDLILSNRVNEWWCRCPVKRVSTACYALSRRGIERMADLYNGASVGNPQLRAEDQYFEPEYLRGCNFYCAYPNIAIQCRTSNTQSSYSPTQSSYDQENIDIESYKSY